MENNSKRVFEYYELPDFFCAGVSGSGKDTLADYLKGYYGYHKMRIADTIKRIICERYNMSFEELEVAKRTNPELRKAHHEVGEWISAHINRIDLLCKRKAMDYQHIENSETPICLVDVRGFDEVVKLFENNVHGLFLTRSNTTEFSSNHWTDAGFFNLNGLNIFDKLIEKPSAKIIVVDNGGLFNNDEFVALYNNKYAGKVDFELIQFNAGVNINAQLLVDAVDDKLTEIYPDIVNLLK